MNTAEATVAVGDAENDLVMLSMAGCGVAVGNALASVKERADLVMAGTLGKAFRRTDRRPRGHGTGVR